MIESTDPVVPRCPPSLWGLCVVLVVSLLSACAGDIVTSVRYDHDPTYVHTGIPYSLPCTAVECKVTFDEHGVPTASLKTSAVPDPGQQYFLVHETNWLYDDKLTIETSGEGFVSSVAGDSTDRTLELVKGLGDLAIAFAKARIAAGGTIPVKKPQGVGSKGLNDAEFDVESKRILKACKERMAARCIDLKGKERVVLTALPRQPANWRHPIFGDAQMPPDAFDFVVSISASRLDSRSMGAPSGEDVQERGRGESQRKVDGHVTARDLASLKEIGGVLVRGKETYILEATVSWDPTSDDVIKGLAREWMKDPKSAAAAAWSSIEEERRLHFALGYSTIIAPVFDYAPVSVIPVERAVFVNAKTTVTFTGGVLAKVDISRPSTFGAAVNSPIDVAKSLLAIPAELVQLKIDTRAAEEKADATEAEARANKVKEHGQRLKDYYAAKDAASEAIATYRAKDWTNKEQEQRKEKAAIVQLMLAANTAASLAGEPRPYSKADIGFYSP